MLFKSPFVAILIASYMTLSGCDNSQKPTNKPISSTPVATKKPTPKNEVRFLDQGLSKEDRLACYYLSQGSQLLPYAWFIGLETSDNQTLFKSDSNMQALGYIPHEKDSGKNPDGLPIGFVKNDDPATVSVSFMRDRDIKKEFLGPDYDTKQYPPTNAWLGFTCANCHTSEISYQGRKIRIDGGSSHSDHQ